jgi:Raf kinase inhibitor-like YbhB/YbcL family protein
VRPTKAKKEKTKVEKKWKFEFKLKSHRLMLAGAALTIAVLAGRASAEDDPPGRDFDLYSTTFTNNSILPLSMIYKPSGCSINGSPGGNQSPELSWTRVPPGTRTFVVVLYDATGSFTHWGMYNIAGYRTGLPENAGVSGSSYGTQIFNDVSGGAEYDGPCPPRNYPPNVHQYVFTLYALDTELNLPGSPNFPPGAETLYQALIAAALNRHILASASLTGLYTTTPGASN